MKLQRKLATKEWYSQEGWVMFVGHYHAGIYAQLYKGHWFNYPLDGIHFETGLTTENLATKTLRLDLHIGHRNLFDRETFNILTIPKMAEIVATWGGDVRFSKSNLSDRLSLDVRFTKTGFSQQIANGFEQLSTLAPTIDDALKQL